MKRHRPKCDCSACYKPTPAHNLEVPMKVNKLAPSRHMCAYWRMAAVLDYPDEPLPQCGECVSCTIGWKPADGSVDLYHERGYWSHVDGNKCPTCDKRNCVCDPEDGDELPLRARKMWA